MSIGPSKYCSECGDSATHDPCYACLREKYMDLFLIAQELQAFALGAQEALVEAESKVTVASCLRSLLDEPSESVWCEKELKFIST